MKVERVVVGRKGLSRYRTGHMWIYRDDLHRTGLARAGAVVEVADEEGRFLGKAFYSEKSKIALRFLTRKREPINESFWRDRITSAVKRRARVARGSKGAVRLVCSEADGLPGLIVDRYSGWLVVQTLNAGIESRLECICGILGEIDRPMGIVCRNDASSRALEGLPREKRMVIGEKPGLVEVEEGEIRYLADLWDGQKTGAYLDQRENRQIAERLARGSCLDCFSYQGHFALHMARAADRVIAVESSKAAISIMERNCSLNGLDNIAPLQANVFEQLRKFQREKNRYDSIVLDPPPLARRRAHIEAALRGYKEINLRAMRLLSRGGMLFTFCCSHAVPRDIFLELLREAAADTRTSLRVIGELGQPSDHPILLSVPETAYLKGFILEKIE